MPSARPGVLRGLWILACGLLRPRKRPLYAVGMIIGFIFTTALLIGILISSLHNRSGASLVVDDAEPFFTDEAPKRSSFLGERSWPQGAVAVRGLMDDVYSGVNGIQLSKEDVAKASTKGTFQKTYGEFEPEGVDALLEELNVTRQDVFCDLGSGTGKVVMQAFLERRPLEAIGLELSEQRDRLAKEARERLLTVLPGSSQDMVSNSLHFVNADVLEADEYLARCNKIFFCSTVWPPDMLAKMEEKFLTLPFIRRPVLIASSRELKAFGTLMEPRKQEGVRFVRHRKVMTSWGASFITLYSLREP